MASLTTREMASRESRRASEHERGVPVNLGTRFSSARAVETLIVSVLRLPVADGGNVPLQDAQGRFLFLEGYSDPGGPDITP